MSDQFRSATNAAKYQVLRESGHLEHGCALCEAPSLFEFKQWRVINNEFPYDLIASVHHMLIPHRHLTEAELSAEEIEELKLIKLREELKPYDYFIEANSHKKSIPQHFHLHLIVGKDLKNEN